MVTKKCCIFVPTKTNKNNIMETITMKAVDIKNIDDLKQAIEKHRVSEIFRLRSVTGQETRSSKLFSEIEFHEFEDEISFFCHDTGRKTNRGSFIDFLTVFETRHFDGYSHFWDSYYIKVVTE